VTSQTTRRALVVDDAPTVRMYHGEILRGLGFDVTEAGNGLEALETALRDSFDLVLVDINMPQMDGYTLIGRLRSAEVGLFAPVVAISTEAERSDAVAAHDSGANHYLVKPVQPDVLRSVAEVLTAALPPTWSPS
jgi:two-component system, chemotaxis family, chemotaxis protein CheY